MNKLLQFSKDVFFGILFVCFVIVVCLYYRNTRKKDQNIQLLEKQHRKREIEISKKLADTKLARDSAIARVNSGNLRFYEIRKRDSLNGIELSKIPDKVNKIKTSDLEKTMIDTWRKETTN